MQHFKVFSSLLVVQILYVVFTGRMDFLAGQPTDSQETL